MPPLVFEEIENNINAIFESLRFFLSIIWKLNRRHLLAFYISTHTYSCNERISIKIWVICSSSTSILMQIPCRMFDTLLPKHILPRKVNVCALQFTATTGGPNYDEFQKIPHIELSEPQIYVVYIY